MVLLLFLFSKTKKKSQNTPQTVGPYAVLNFGKIQVRHIIGHFQTL